MDDLQFGVLTPSRMSCPSENVPAQRWSRQAGRHRQPVIANPIQSNKADCNPMWKLNEYKLLIVVEVLCHHRFLFLLLLISHLSFREALICFWCSIFHIKKFWIGRDPSLYQRYLINIPKLFISFDKIHLDWLIPLPPWHFPPKNTQVFR